MTDIPIITTNSTVIVTINDAEPVIVAVQDLQHIQVPADWNATSGVTQIVNKPVIDDHAILRHLSYDESMHTGFVPSTRKVNGLDLSTDINVVGGLTQEIQFNDGGILNGSANFKFNKDFQGVAIGGDATFYPNNPISIVGDVDSWIQLNIQNRSNGLDASSDLVMTADNGDDFTNYMNVGINNSNYVDSQETSYKANDGYITCMGNNLSIINGNKNDTQFFNGLNSDDLVATINGTGVTIPSNLSYKIGNFDVMNIIAEASNQAQEDALFAAGSKIIIRTDLL
jgi:hypothetical protein